MVYPPESPCGCGSKKPFGECCLRDGEIKLTPKRSEPPLPGTGYCNKKCVLGWTRNCCAKISGDHIVSASVLRILNEQKITISSQSGSREHSIRSSALTVKKLCRRHNSALSVIDAEAARLFKGFVSINAHLSEGTDGQRLYFFHGTDIEYWLLKTLLMVFYSKQSNITPDKFQLPRHAISPFRYELDKPFGLYVPTQTNANDLGRFQTEATASVALITKGPLVCGVNVTLGGLPLTLLIDGEGSDFVSLLKTHTYRPKNLLFFKNDQVFCIGFAFSNGSSSDIWFSHGDANATLPSN
jgi:hypothetical protein